MSQLHTIAVSTDVKRALSEHGRAGESYNTVLKRLLGIENKKEESLSASVGPQSETATVATANQGGTT